MTTARGEPIRRAGGAGRAAPTAGVRLVALVSCVAAFAIACQSPEGKRQRGDGLGGDINNRDPVVEMHAGSRMYYDTPCLLPDEECTGPRPASGLPGDFPGSK
jgi:hypothetical protein